MSLTGRLQTGNSTARVHGVTLAVPTLGAARHEWTAQGLAHSLTLSFSHSPVAALLQHGEVLQGGRDVLRADASQLAQLPDAELPVTHLVETLQHHAVPVGHVGQPAQVGKGLLRGARLALALGQQVAWGDGGG